VLFPERSPLALELGVFVVPDETPTFVEETPVHFPGEVACTIPVRRVSHEFFERLGYIWKPTSPSRLEIALGEISDGLWKTSEGEMILGPHRIATHDES